MPCPTYCRSHSPRGPAKQLGSVDNSFSEALRPATCSRDQENLLNAQHYCTEIDRSGSREQVAGRRHLKCQQPLNIKHFTQSFFMG